LARGLLGQQSIYFLVSKQAHLRQYTIRAPLARVFSSKSFLGALFVGICPVEDLFFDELACGQRPKWCAGEVEIGFGRDREEFDLLFRKHCEVFVHILEVGDVFELLLRDGFFLTLKQFLRRISPRRSGIRQIPRGPKPTS
jgi:hypothetical protein